MGFESANKDILLYLFFYNFSIADTDIEINQW